MALQGSGTIELSEIQTEFTGSNPISLSEYYRDGGYVTSNNTNVPTSGAVSLSQFYNAVRQFAFTISTSYTTTQDLRTLALAAGWDGAAPVVATVNSGITLRGAAGAGGASNGAAGGAGSAGLTVTGSFPAGVALINNGTIRGAGGGGGGGNGGNGGAGGASLIVSTAISITNNGTLSGGGGGGGGGAIWGAGGIVRHGGGGGGGATFGIGGVGATGDGINGGAGATGTETAGGAGGSSDQNFNIGGTGGALATAGQAGYARGSANNGTPGTGGAAGVAVSGNSYVTWVATGTRYGALV